MANKLTRREVLKGTATAAVGLAVGPMLAQASPPVRRSKRLRIGIIGCGGKGWSGMEEASAHGDIVALADIDTQNLTKALLEHPRASTFVDYRQMLEDSM